MSARITAEELRRVAAEILIEQRRAGYFAFCPQDRHIDLVAGVLTKEFAMPQSTWPRICTKCGRSSAESAVFGKHCLGPCDFSIPRSEHHGVPWSPQ